MDIATILGLVVGILVVVEMGGGVAGIWQGPILLLVVVGGGAATLIAFPLRDALNVAGVLRKVFFGKPVSPSQLIERVVKLSETARAWGILRLEQAIAEEDDEFLAQGVRLAVDGTEPELIMDIMATELDFIEQRHARAQRLWETLGRFWALFGGVGALVVLVQQPGGSGAELVGRAAAPLFYGVLLYVLVAGPFARKLQACSEDEILVKRMTLEGIIGIQSGDNPSIIEHKLAIFMAPSYRPDGDQPASPPAAPPADDRTREEVEAFARDKTGLVLGLVREAVEGHEADAEQKARVEESVARVDRGEMPLVALLAMLDQGVRDEIVRRIQHPPPRLTGPVPTQDLDFEDIGRLTDQEIQTLLREVDQRDLVVALKGASDALREKVLGCMSERVRTFISEEMQYSQVRPEVVLMMQARVVVLALELSRRGLIRTE